MKTKYSKSARAGLSVGRWGGYLAASALSLIAANGVTAQDMPDPDSIGIPDLNEVKVPEPDRYQLDNGMVVFMVVNRDFPLVDAQALIRVGSVYEPADKAGLSSIAGQVMRTGGSINVDGDALDATLESMGASVETSIGETSGSASISTLKEDFPRGLEILGDLLRNPAFPEEKVELAKKQEKTAIASRNDEPMSVLSRELPKLIYGEDSPYARHTEHATIDAITRDDLVALHKRFFHPDRVILTIYGDFDEEQVKAEVERVFGDWPPASEPLPPEPKPEFADVSGNFLVKKGDMTNSFVLMGHPGLRMSDPDYPAMRLYHEIMGGGFSSRLFNEIRTKRGLAYASGSSAGAGLHHPGGEIFFAATQSDSTVATLGYVREEIRKSLAEPFTEQELQQAKDGILNSMVFQYSNGFAVLNRLAVYEYHGYPADFLTTYQQAIQNLTADEILAAAQRNVVPDEMATMVMGNSENFAADLPKLGQVQELDITIPEPEGEEIPIATDADLERGMGLVQGMAKAHNASQTASIKDLKISESGEFKVQGMSLQISIETERLLPSCEKSVQKLPMGEFASALCGDVAWINQMQGPTAMPPEAVSEAKKSQSRDYFNLLAGYSDMKFQALPEQKDVNGRLCDVVFVHSDIVAGWKLFIDSANQQLVQMMYKDRSMMTGAPVTATETFADFKPVSGVAWPHSREIYHDGDLLATLTVNSIAANTGITEDAFAMPSQ